jgi:hypothetical protein
MPKSAVLISQFRSPVDQLTNAAALVHAFQTPDDIRKCWPRLRATLAWISRRRALTNDRLIAAADWLLAAAQSGPFTGPDGAAYRLEIEQLVGEILGKAPATEWHEPSGPDEGTDLPADGDGSQEPGVASPPTGEYNAPDHDPEAWPH